MWNVQNKRVKLCIWSLCFQLTPLATKWSDTKSEVQLSFTSLFNMMWKICRGIGTDMLLIQRSVTFEPLCILSQIYLTFIKLRLPSADPRRCDGPNESFVADAAQGSSWGSVYGGLLYLHGSSLRHLRRKQCSRHRRHLWSPGTNQSSAPSSLRHQGQSQSTQSPFYRSVTRLWLAKSAVSLIVKIKRAHYCSAS